MKSDHLFAVIIFNKVYIMLAAKIKCITKPQTSWLNMLFRNFLRALSIFSGHLKQHSQSTFGLTLHPTAIMVPQGFLKLFCTTGLRSQSIYKHTHMKI